MKLSFECEVPSLSESERDALSRVVQRAISHWLFQNAEIFTEEDIDWLKAMDRSFYARSK